MNPDHDRDDTSQFAVGCAQAQATRIQDCNARETGGNSGWKKGLASEISLVDTAVRIEKF